MLSREMEVGRLLFIAATLAALMLVWTDLSGTMHTAGAISGTVTLAGCAWYLQSRLRARRASFRRALLHAGAHRIVQQWRSGSRDEEVLRSLAELLGVPALRVDLRPADRAGTDPAGRGEPDGHPVQIRFADRCYGALVIPGAAAGPPPGTELTLLAEFARELGSVMHEAVGAQQPAPAADSALDSAADPAAVPAAGAETDSGNAVRRQLQRDLHDGIGPMLAAVKMQLDSARVLLPIDATAAAALLDKACADANVAVTDVRRLSRELRAGQVGDLVPALSQQAARFERATNGHLRVRVVTRGRGLPRLPDRTASAAYRIATEALTNTARHARAKHCTISLAAVGGSLLVEVTDDGIGIPADPFPSGVGLLSMSGRARDLGGDWQLTRCQPHGTRVTVRLPLRAACAEETAAAPAPAEDRGPEFCGAPPVAP
ncbi:hypothetical protein GCM10009738_84750 [Kitasatospora viridis]